MARIRAGCPTARRVTDRDPELRGRGDEHSYQLFPVVHDIDHTKSPVAHPAVHLHYPSNYSSWLNQVDLWFSKSERDVFARGTFTSVTDLRPKLMRYIKGYNKVAKHFRGAYAEPSKRTAWLLYKSTVRSAGASYGHRNV